MSNKLKETTFLKKANLLLNHSPFILFTTNHIKWINPKQIKSPHNRIMVFIVCVFIVTFTTPPANVYYYYNLKGTWKFYFFQYPFKDFLVNIFLFYIVSFGYICLSSFLRKSFPALVDYSLLYSSFKGGFRCATNFSLIRIPHQFKREETSLETLQCSIPFSLLFFYLSEIWKSSFSRI